MATKSNDKLNRQRLKGDDEYYTKYSSVQYVVENSIGEFLKDKIIYCPCDSDQSNIVKYFKDTKDKWKYKELIYTSDNLFTHKDIFKKCDIIFTNPPFKHFPKLIKFLETFHKQYVLWISNVQVANVDNWPDKFNIVFLKCVNELNLFDKPDGTEAKVNVVIVSNIKDAKCYYNNRPLPKLEDYTKLTLLEGLDNGTIRIVDTVSSDLQVKYEIKNANSFPTDYYDPVAVSTTTTQLLYKDLDIILLDTRCFINGRLTFARDIVKQKQNK